MYAPHWKAKQGQRSLSAQRRYWVRAACIAAKYSRATGITTTPLDKSTNLEELLIAFNRKFIATPQALLDNEPIT